MGIVHQGLRPFANIWTDAVTAHGAVTVDAAATAYPPSPVAVIEALPCDRILAAMARRIFSAGFSGKAIEASWPRFEEAFFGFDSIQCAAIHGEIFDALLKDARIIRNGAKIRAVQRNAQWILQLAAEHGSPARFFARWPDADYVGLLALMIRYGDRLGGDTGPRFLRAIGKPAFIMTGDVAKALVREGVVTAPPTSKADRAKVQSAFNMGAGKRPRPHRAQPHPCPERRLD